MEYQINLKRQNGKRWSLKVNASDLKMAKKEAKKILNRLSWEERSSSIVNIERHLSYSKEGYGNPKFYVK